MAKKKKKKRGHYCRICGEHKSNEAFSGKGHAKHVCKVCNALPQEKKNELRVLSRIGHIGEKYPKSRQDWELLEKYAGSNKYPDAKELALFFLEMSGRRVSSPKLKNNKSNSQEAILLSELDPEIREDIIAEIYEQIINYMYQEEKLPDEKQKQNTLDKICNVLFVEHRDLLTGNKELELLYEETLREVIRDIENDEF